MHKGEDLDCKLLSVMMRHVNILKYFSFGIESLWTYIYIYIYIYIYSCLAGTSLTVITEMFQVRRSKSFRYSSDYAIQPPGKSIQHK